MNMSASITTERSLHEVSSTLGQLWRGDVPLIVSKLNEKHCMGVFLLARSLDLCICKILTSYQGETITSAIGMLISKNNPGICLI
jgi:hypothetical protein